MKSSQPLIVLLLMAVGIIITSHHYFSSDPPVRRIRKARHDWGARTTSSSHHHTRRIPEPEPDPYEPPPAADEGEMGHAEEGEAPLVDGVGSDGGVEVKKKAVSSSSSSSRSSAVALADPSSVPALDDIVRMAETSMVAYPNAADEFDCTPKQHARPTRALDYVAPQSESAEWPVNCGEGREELCAVVKRTAINREVLVAVCNSGVISQLAKWVESNRRAKIENMMIVAIDERLPRWLDENKVAYWKRTTSAQGSHKISAQKFGYVRDFVTVGCSVIMSDIDVVYLQNPFSFLHRDVDIEGTTDGWDDGSAYGWTERLDDPSMGAAGRFRPSMRITAWNSGLWYARATKASLRLMTILAYRMEHEDTWDQAAFGEEVARPSRDDHMAGGIVKRALNHWCFANSKTLFRRIRVEERFKDHVPVVVHANYHQPKQPRMDAVYDRWHLSKPDALNRFRGEQAFTVPAPKLEEDFMHMINDGFVSGANTRDALSAVTRGGCKPQPSAHGLTMASLHVRPRLPCAETDLLCAAAAGIAKRRDGGDGAGTTAQPELMVVLGGAADVEALKVLLGSAARARVTNLLLILTDRSAQGALGRDAPPLVDSAGVAATSTTGPLSIVQSLSADGATDPLARTAGRYALLGRLLSYGFGLLYANPSTVLLSDPFASLYRDADIEAMSAGWDDGSAYGYNHVLDDPSMGFTRFCHGSRIVSYEPGFVFLMPTTEAIALTARMSAQLRTRYELSALSSAAEVLAAEREALVHELWLPSHHEYASIGAVLRVMNYYCFVNSKVLFRQLRASSMAKTPVAVQINYHSDVVPRMKATVSAYLDGSKDQLMAMPLADASGGGGGSSGGGSSASVPTVGCQRADGATEGDLASELVARSPYAWGGIGDMGFEAGGVLKTPWGVGKWGLHPDDSSGRTFYADFVGAKHNVHMAKGSGIGVSTRCADSNVVLVRSIKSAKQKAAK